MDYKKKLMDSVMQRQNSKRKKQLTDDENCTLVHKKYCKLEKVSRICPKKCVNKNDLVCKDDSQCGVKITSNYCFLPHVHRRCPIMCQDKKCMTNKKKLRQRSSNKEYIRKKLEERQKTYENLFQINAMTRIYIRRYKQKKKNQLIFSKQLAEAVMKNIKEHMEETMEEYMTPNNHLTTLTNSTKKGKLIKTLGSQRPLTSLPYFNTNSKIILTETTPKNSTTIFNTLPYDTTSTSSQNYPTTFNISTNFDPE
ncbi:hypothetical protein SNEBB_005838 [Seison nebaliae]|nr:hypothetical protein SNEBB_005838 [Seison nebaliae]